MERNLKITDERDIDPSLDLEEEIARLKKELNAVILAHYYQEPELQDIADFVGDSLDLSRKAASTDADVIIFCGVTFMAEVAKILNPDKLVLVPDLNAGCSLEESCPPEAFKALRDKNPDHLALTYINCSAEVKAISDIIVTSSNAEAIINQLPKKQKILFSPDKYLGGYLAKKTGRDMLLWEGTCVVHEQFSEKALVKLKTQHPKARVIAHPECPEVLLNYSEHIGSTSSLINYTKEHEGDEFIVLTEHGILHEMKKQSPKSTFYDVPGTTESCASCNDCPFMKLNTIEKLYMCMVNKDNSIELNSDLIKRAKKPLAKMLEMSPKKPAIGTKAA